VTKENPSFIYHDTSWLVVNKPTGISTHAAHAGDLGVAEWLKLHLATSVHVFSRLDKGTSGVLVMALTTAARAKAMKIHRHNLSKKTYYFVSNKKHDDQKNWACKTPLDGEKCETVFWLEKSTNRYHLYRAEIARGKTHQIRRHAALCHIPILGDDEYAGAPFPRLCLHCAQVAWPEIQQELKAAMPDSFLWLLEGRDNQQIHTACAYERRQHWLAPVTDAFRVVHRGEVLDQPASIDVYGPWMSMTVFDEKISAQQALEAWQPTLNDLASRYNCHGGLVRVHRQNPHQRKLTGALLGWGEPFPTNWTVREHDLLYNLVFDEAQHVGLFLDQRDSRQRLAQVAVDRRVANLFSFTCSFSAVAAKAGAEVVFSVDLAKGCLEQGKKNFALNKLTDEGRGKFIQGDVRTWLAKQLRQKKSTPVQFAPWDFIVCDPPVFAVTGHGHSFSVAKMWPELAGNVSALLSDRGIALFANNHRGGSDRFYHETLKKHFSSVTPLSPPLDFPELPGRPTHVRIFWCQR
jgi:23S rRNA (cytosine1962-C5)-methyltransferase